MGSEQFLKLCCVVLFLGSAQAINKFNTTARHPPFERLRPFQNAYLEPCSEEGLVVPSPDSCAEYWECWGGEFWPIPCDVGELFDPRPDVLWCMPEDEVTCLDNSPEPEDDDDCPPAGSNEVRFLPSLYCDEFYICINGQPILLFCRPGQHWNVEEEFCDEPWKAGCYDGIEPPPEGHPDQLPKCPAGFRGQLPHPHNCNWFIHCDNGSRSIQQCQHLHHFDMDQRRCLFQTAARCIKHARN